MDTKSIAVISGATLLALTATASAGPMNETSPAAIVPPQIQAEIVPPQIQADAVAYHNHHVWHPWVWHRFHLR